jgi:dTDP-4-amino-4,6-dideoxygalactose transaminase
MNSRLDTIQAAVLLEKLSIFPDEIEARNRVAARYAALLEGAVATPRVIEGGVSTWAQYVIETPNRDGMIAHLNAQGIPTAVYYPIPIHQQSAYARFPCGPGGLPVSEAKAHVVLALPMHPYLSEADQDRICAAVREAAA